MSTTDGVSAFCIILYAKLSITKSCIKSQSSCFVSPIAKISPKSFYQVNPVQTEKLYQLALDYAELSGGETVVDAYCGAGTISLMLARKAKKVIGIEIVESAVECAKENAAKCGIKKTDSDVATALRTVVVLIFSWIMVFIVAGVLLQIPLVLPFVKSKILLNKIHDRLPETKVYYFAIEPRTYAIEGGTFSQKSYDLINTVNLLHSKTGIVETVLLDEYIVHVVAAEMPVDYELEALKAQAIVARTYTMYKITGDKKHENADICDNSACCQAWISKDDRFNKWGDNCTEKWNKLVRAVNETKGKYITYNGKVINAFFHSNSSGKTEKSENVIPETPKDIFSMIVGEELDEEIIEDVVLEEADPRLPEFEDLLELEESAEADMQITLDEPESEPVIEIAQVADSEKEETKNLSSMMKKENSESDEFKNTISNFNDLPKVKNAKSKTYYIQIATVNKEENVAKIIDLHGKKYPVYVIKNPFSWHILIYWNYHCRYWCIRHFFIISS